MKRLKVFLWLFGILLLIPTFGISTTAIRWQVPSDLIGTWSGRMPASVRTHENGKFQFIMAKDSIDVIMTIAPDGSVSGTFGKAEFKDCRIAKNRGWLGRALNLATDCCLEGSLAGSIFDGDPTPNKLISGPFTYEHGKMTGSVFQIKLPGLYPMTGLELTLIRK